MREGDLAPRCLSPFVCILGVRWGERVTREHVAAEGGRDEQRAKDVDDVVSDRDEPAARARLEVRLHAKAFAEVGIPGSMGAE